MPPSDSGLSRQAIGWALLGQAIWLPVLVIAVHDRWLSGRLPPTSETRSREVQGRAAAPPLSLGDVVNQAPPPSSARPSPAGSPGQAQAWMPPPPGSAAAAGAAGLVLRSPGSGPVRPPAVAPASQTVSASSPASPPATGRPAAAPEFVQAPATTWLPVPPPPPISPSQLLGGTLALRDLPEALRRLNTPPNPGPGSSSGGPARSAGGGKP